MNCPHCGHEKSRVCETRPAPDSDRRIRRCSSCSRTFTTVERIAVYAGRAAGWIEAQQADEPPAPTPEQAQDIADAAAAKQRNRLQRWSPLTCPEGVCPEAQPLLLEWWNESRRSRHRGDATWTEAAWVASAQRVANLPPEQQVALCKAGVEHGWQALKPEYLSGLFRGREPAPAGDGRPMPKDPAMLAALHVWPFAS